MININSDNVFLVENCENKEWIVYVVFKYNVCVVLKYVMINNE